MKEINNGNKVKFFDMVRIVLLVSFLIIHSAQAFAQHYDTLVGDSVNHKKMQVYVYKGNKYLYAKPKIYSFLTDIPATFVGMARETVRKKSLPAIGIMVASSAVLIAADQSILKGVQRFSRFIGLKSANSFKDAVHFKLGKNEIDVYQAPQNFNTFLYSLGEGLPPILIASGLIVHGAVKNDYRAISTASQIMQSNISMGIITQILKRTAGRESPSQSTQAGGVWRPLSLGQYSHNVPKHDAFPSGHMGTLMSTVTVLALNYPEKKWIRPIGYAVMAIVGFAMINNEVHWAGDYPFAIALGYVSAKTTVNMNRFVNGSYWKRK